MNAICVIHGNITPTELLNVHVPYLSARYQSPFAPFYSAAAYDGNHAA
ncbi:hypothetical protein [Chromatium okenii]|nr:hypothetical protein [Chromatium okenii]